MANGLFLPYLFVIVLVTFLKELFQEIYHTYKKPINYVWYLSISLVTTGIVVLRPPLFPS
jgi:hypothetical protein